MTLCEHGCGTELRRLDPPLERGDEVHTSSRCRDALRALLDALLGREPLAAALVDTYKLQRDTELARAEAATAKLVEAERERDQLKREYLCAECQYTNARAERFRALLERVVGHRPHGPLHSLIVEIRAALAADSAPEAGKRCDECDWTFGCFNGSAPCCKKSAGAATEKEGP